MSVAAAFYDWLVLLHVLGAMVWLGGASVLVVLGAYVLRRDDPQGVAQFLGSLRVVGPALLAPAVITLIALGVWLVLDSPAWDFGQTWIVIGFVLFAAAFVVGVAFQSRAALTAERSAERGDHPEAVRQLTRWSGGMRVILICLVLATADMVLKPGL